MIKAINAAKEIINVNASLILTGKTSFPSKYEKGKGACPSEEASPL